MKRFPLFILIGLIAGSMWAQNLNKFPNGYRVVRDWGQDKGTATISNMLDAVSTTNQWTMIFDGGKWSISNSVTIPSNITVVVMPGTYFDIASGQVMAFNSNNLAVLHSERLFSGLGTATGQAQMVYRIPDWGSESQYDIGPGHLPAAVSNLYYGNTYYDAAGQILTWTNMYQNNGFILGSTNLSDFGGLIITTNTLADNIAAIYPNLQTNSISAGVKSEVGFWPTYIDTNTITISRGTISANGTEYRSESIITQDVSGLPNLTNIVYGYLDDSASSSTTNITVYTSTNHPTYVNALAGYYCSSSTADRVIFAIPYTNSAIAGFICSDTGDLVVRYDQPYACATNLNPTGGWQIPDLNEASTFLPINASHVYLAMSGDESVQQQLLLAATTFEMTNTFAEAGVPWLPSGANYTFNQGATLMMAGSSDTGSGIPMSGWMQLGASRNVRIAGENDDENDLGCSVAGWRIYR